MADDDKPERSAESRLREYFDEAERVAGYRSCQGAQIDRRAGHIGAAENPDGWAPRGWTPARSAIIRRCAEVRRWLAALTPLQRDVLTAVYAVDAAYWQAYADNALRAKGIGIELVNRFGDLVGVALLLAPVRQGSTPSSPPPCPAPVVEGDAAFRGRLAGCGEWLAAKADWQLDHDLDHLSRGELDLAAWWLGEAPRQVRLRSVAARGVRLDDHGAGAWLVRLEGKEAVAAHLAAARAAQQQALAAFHRVSGIAPPQPDKKRRTRVYRYEAPAPALPARVRAL